MPKNIQHPSAYCSYDYDLLDAEPSVTGSMQLDINLLEVDLPDTKGTRLDHSRGGPSNKAMSPAIEVCCLEARKTAPEESLPVALALLIRPNYRGENNDKT